MLRRTDSPDRPPSHAGRQRRYRKRQRNGEAVVTIALSREETDTLCRLRCLDLDRLEDRGAIADAIHLLLAHILDA
jgi:hypothetical protein